jgi:hypothetical protein
MPHSNNVDKIIKKWAKIQRKVELLKKRDINENADFGGRLDSEQYLSMAKGEIKNRFIAIGIIAAMILAFLISGTVQNIQKVNATEYQSLTNLRGSKG